MGTRVRTCKVLSVADDGSLTLIDKDTGEELTGVKFTDELAEEELEMIRHELLENHGCYVRFTADGDLIAIGSRMPD